MKQQLLLLEDVEGLGRSGDLVVARPGYVRNYLLPQKKAIVASNRTLRLQEKLREQRLLQATADRQEAEELAATLKDIVLEFLVRVDPDNNMYGSVTVSDIIQAAATKGIALVRKNFPHAHYAVKKLGRHLVELRLKEDVSAMLVLEIASDHELPRKENTDLSVEGKD